MQCANVPTNRPLIRLAEHGRWQCFLPLLFFLKIQKFNRVDIQIISAKIGLTSGVFDLARCLRS